MSIDVVKDIDPWLTGTLLPLWIARVFDPARPGYVETWAADGRPEEVDLRTTLVTARLVYVFSHAHLLAVPGALEAARHGVSFLLNRCRRADGQFSHSCTPTGDPVDKRSDFYDLAFTIFALAWYAKATGDTDSLVEAESVMTFIETALPHSAGGFREDTSGSLPRRQNPHMHLLEACHAMAEISPDPRWLARADGLVSLMRAHILDPQTGSLGEFFDENWNAWPGTAGTIREPGHHYEWTWLLYHHERLSGSTGARQVARQLFAFAEGHRDGDGPVVNEVDPSGATLNGAALLWPQTEYIKALAARTEFENDGAAAEKLDRHLRLMFERFIDVKTGIWFNELDKAGTPVRAAVPVRVLYHLVMALADCSRVRRMKRSGP